MARQAISVTLNPENLTWLRARVGAGGGRSVSDLLDQMVTEARKSGGAGAARSVVGTIEIDQSDPLLESADGLVRAVFERSASRPIAVRERRRSYRVRGVTKRRA
jgi:hypothetical protein